MVCFSRRQYCWMKPWGPPSCRSVDKKQLSDWCSPNRATTHEPKSYYAMAKLVLHEMPHRKKLGRIFRGKCFVVSLTRVVLFL